MFIKHGDGKIVSVIKTEEELTEEQKKAVKKISQQTEKPELQVETSNKSGR